MIEIKIESGTYSESELRSILAPTFHFNTGQNLDLFITAMEKTGQLKKTPKGYQTTDIGKPEEAETTLFIRLESSYVSREEKISGIHVFRWTTRYRIPPGDITVRRIRIRGRYYNVAYRKGRRGIFRRAPWSPNYTMRDFKKDVTGAIPRIAVRAGKEWVERNGMPLKIVLQKIFRNGDEIDIVENPVLEPVKPRYPDTIEAYRAEIPSRIVQKYNLTGNEPIQAVVTQKKKTFSFLKLWGYNLDVAITFEYKSEESGREMELLGNNFKFEVGPQIKSTIEKRKEKAHDVLEVFMDDWDAEYFRLYEGCITSSKGDTVEGYSLVPYKNEPEVLQEIILEDLAKGRTLIVYQADLPLDWVYISPGESAKYFRKIVDNVVHGVKARFEQYSTAQAKLNVEGF